ncbi:MAG: transposase family protein [Firmicutes bacterium]|nr:transposase family protein [Bacillota bacterium]
MDRFFFQLSVIDVFDREVMAYHLGLCCTAKDAVRVLRRAVAKRGLSARCQLILRTDNEP